MSIERAILGGGCFWCLDAVFREVQGVTQVRSGYAGGARPSPSYEQICSGATGHAEVVEILFDASKIAYRTLLEIFFTIHDPTTLNRQGNDIGTQYRSVIFTTSDEQEDTAQEVISVLHITGAFKNAIVTEVTPAPEFWPAEDYHQDYFNHNSGQPYCQIVIGPKLQKFRQLFGH